MALSAILGSSCAPTDGEPFSPDLYLADLQQLETLTATTYANFEWAISEGGIDPVELHRRARGVLLAARSAEEARAALSGFVETFGDGHFRLREPGGPVAGPEDRRGPGPATPPAQACAALGYEEHDQSFRLDLGADFRLVTAADDPFPAGWFERHDKKRIGVLRLDEFGAERYGELCPTVWEAYRGGLQGPCSDWECRHRFGLEVADRLLSEIERRIARLAAEAIDALVIDITGNGGGSDWNDPAARLLSGKVLRGNERSVVRHPHWRSILEEMAAEVAVDLGRDDLSGRERVLLEEVASRLDWAVAEAASTCDLSHVWERGAGDLPCSILVRGALFSTGLVAVPPEVDASQLTIGQALFTALDYRPRGPAWIGPLAILVDQGTASAAEMFAALLRDNDAAVLVGQPTFGVGCGYTNGGIQTVLEYSGLEVWLPDCVRHRRGGGNERAGLAPDIAVNWERTDSPSVRGLELRAALARWQLEP